MKISCSEIENWANNNKKVATTTFPELIRKLLRELYEESITNLSIPDGDATASTGIDGEFKIKDGNSYFEKGNYMVEIGTGGNSLKKFKSDIDKRSKDETLKNEYNNFLFFTSNVWHHNKNPKAETALEYKNNQNWNNVIILDASDISSMLENAPVTNMWFLKNCLGVNMDGVFSIESFNNYIMENTIKDGADLELFAFDDYENTAKSIDFNNRNRMVNIKSKSIDESLYRLCFILKKMNVEKVLIVDKKERWEELRNRKITGYILVPNFISDNIDNIPNNLILVPCSNINTNSNPNKIELPRLSRKNLEKNLNNFFDYTETYNILKKSNMVFSVLKRKMFSNIHNKRQWEEDIEKNSFLMYLSIFSQINLYEKGDVKVLEYITGSKIKDIKKILKSLNKKEPLALYVESINKIIIVDQEDLLMSNKESLLNDEDFIDKLVKIIKMFKSESSDKHSNKLMRSLYTTICNLSRGINCKLSRLLSEIEEIFKSIKYKEDWIKISTELHILSELTPNSFLDAIEGDLKKNNVLKTFEYKWDRTYQSIIQSIRKLARIKLYAKRVIKILVRLCEFKKNQLSEEPFKALIACLIPWYNEVALNEEAKINLLGNITVSASVLTNVEIFNWILPSFGGKNISPSMELNYLKSEVIENSYGKLLKGYYEIFIDIAFKELNYFIVLLDKYTNIPLDMLNSEHIKRKMIALLEGKSDEEKYKILKKIREVMVNIRDCSDSKSHKFLEELCNSIEFGDGSYKFLEYFEWHLSLKRMHKSKENDYYLNKDQNKKLFREKISQLSFEELINIEKKLINKDFQCVELGEIIYENSDKKISNIKIFNNKFVIKGYSKSYVEGKELTTICKTLANENFSNYKIISLLREIEYDVQGLNTITEKFKHDIVSKVLDDIDYHKKDNQFKKILFNEFKKLKNSYKLFDMIYSDNHNLFQINDIIYTFKIMKDYKEFNLNRYNNYRIIEMLEKLYNIKKPSELSDEDLKTITEIELKIIDKRDNFCKYLIYALSKDYKFYTKFILSYYTPDKCDGKYPKNIAYYVLDKLKFIPLINNDYRALKKWMEDIIEFGKRNDLEKVISNIIGKLFSNEMNNCIADVYETLHTKDIGEVLIIEILNKRGLFSQSHGKEEMKLSNEYKNKSEDYSEFLNLSRIYKSVSENYMRDSEFSKDLEDFTR